MQMQELNMPSKMRTVVMKLSFKLRECWRERACEIIEFNQGTAKFSHIVASYPMFGCIQDKQSIAVSKQDIKGKQFCHKC